MKRAILIAAMFMPAANAMAISRYDARAMTCETAQNYIKTERAVIFRYPYPGSNKLIYDRFVSSESLCTGFGNAMASFLSTKDDLMCPATICESGREND